METSGIRKVKANLAETVCLCVHRYSNADPKKHVMHRTWRYTKGLLHQNTIVNKKKNFLKI
jgi:hypothetical protein